MIKNKIFNISIIFLIICFTLILIGGSFLFGVKTGLLREKPYFDKVIQVYNFSKEFKKAIRNIFDINNVQTVGKLNLSEIENKQYLVDEYKLGIQTGKIPSKFVLVINMSLRENNQINHYLVFIYKNNIIHQVVLDERKFKKSKNIYKWPHGFLISDSKYIYYNFDSGNSLVKKNICGELIWEIEGQFHHLMSINKNYIWALLKEKNGDYDIAEKFVKINADSGKIIKSFSTKDLIKANLPFDFFSIKQRDLSNIWEYEPFHFNDIDVLTDEFSNYFEKFEEGDLMISSRSLNSIFIINPDSLKIKKFLFGIARRQHDPDWNKGYVTIYDNQTYWGIDDKGREIRPHKSRIIKIKSFVDDSIETLKFDTSFESDARGNHHILDLGNNEVYSLIVSPYEGKLLLFKENKKIYTIINNQKGDVFPISNGKIFNNKRIIDNIKTCKN